MDASTCKLVAWCIALEGSIELGNTGRRVGFCPSIKLYNTNKEIVTQFLLLVDSMGIVYVNNYKNPKYKPCWVWRCQKLTDVKNIIENIIDFLPSKKEQAQLVLEFIDLRLECQTSWHKKGSSHVEREEEIYLKMKELNKRGKTNNG